ncbi:MAG: carboxypeptidase regulatory-like domain-containing protein [Euryarchaeota archaeon]|nr:carboxypeptidase regulatory-like domain-containing protein [Euryarchaeota archaeon]
MGWHFFWAAAALVLMAGCMGGEASLQRLPVITPTIDARPTATEVNEGPGAIEGLVVDDEFRPLPQSLVEVFRRKSDIFLQLKLTTDEGGRFAARGLAEGQYIVYVGRVGYYDDRPRLFVVEDGRSTTHTWTLEPLPAPDPFHKTFNHRAGFTAFVCAQVLGQNVSAACDPLSSRSAPTGHVVDEINQTDLHTLVVEANWTPAAPLVCNAGVLTHVFGPGHTGTLDDAAASNPNHWDNLPRVKAPTRLFVPRYGDEPVAMLSAHRRSLNGGENVTTHGRWQFVMEPYAAAQLGTVVDVSCLVFQTVDEYATVFHGRAAAVDWSALT